MSIADHETVSVPDSELTHAEAEALFDALCHRELNVSGADFLAAYDADTIPPSWDTAAVSRVEFRLHFVR